ncbi:hypothetical protein C9374_012396 [Naegleria lovaniensis]|uniref:Phosphatidic acid phosphatase type 2/haloperoxidase domain-containing protein n=1 Tax=Naegleria lovaniensis TaxID=51637 RepID=A0AA88GX24_NAELO|nr:uncharacterized protein C9374_012396 [Naegleria lovaniensis]KAG2392144.1 hypothetical protein C9374_012396 [Naegleria lovaniensis]
MTTHKIKQFFKDFGKQSKENLVSLFRRKTRDNYFITIPHEQNTSTTSSDTIPSNELGKPLQKELSQKSEKRKRVMKLILYYSLEYIIPLLCLGLVLGVLLSGGIPTFSLPYFYIEDPTLSYPKHQHDILPLWEVAAIYVLLIPLVSFLLFHLLFIRNLVDFHHALVGYVQTIALCMAITAFGWLVYGGYRPTFLVECNPNMKVVNEHRKSGNTLLPYRYFKPTDVCQNPENFRLSSPLMTSGFPSGHVSSVMSVWLFFLLYFAGKADTWNRRKGQFWKVFLFFLLLLVPVWVGVTRIVTLKHTISQVVVGILIGIFSALLVYRYKYCSIFGVDAKTPNYYMWQKQQPSTP